MIAKSEYKSPINFPKSGYELLTCHYPLRVDVYSGCFHNCLYCYAKKLLSSKGYWNPTSIRVADLNKIKRTFFLALNNKQLNDPISIAIRKKLPVRLGGLTDCFQKCEIKTKTTLGLIKFLNEIEYPYLIVTKSDIVAQQEYLKELSEGMVCVQVTLISLNDKILNKIEPNVIPSENRLNALKRLSDAKIFTCGRISPVIPEITTANIHELVNKLKNVGVRHILVEFFRGTESMIKNIEDATKISLMGYMEKGRYYFKVKKDYKINFYKLVRRLCIEQAIGFSVCSDGDQVPNEYNTTKNCCGTDSLKGFENCVECTTNNLLTKILKNGEVSLSDMKKEYWSPDFSFFEKFWNNGRLAELIPNIEKKGNKYILKNKK